MNTKTDLPENFDPQSADRNIAKAIDEGGKVKNNEIYLSTGVVLVAKQANPSMLIRAMTAHRRPTPPVVFIENMGREMENPDDPDYISRVDAWQMEYSNSMLTVFIGLGTELKSLPKGFEGPHPKTVKKPILDKGKPVLDEKKNPTFEDVEKTPAWLEDYRAMGLTVVPNSPTWRYTAWVMYKAAPTKEDTDKITEAVKSLSGIKEADVKDAGDFPAGN